MTYATGKQCEKVPKKECKYVQVFVTFIVELGIPMFLLKRFQSVAQFLTRSVKRAMKINAR